MMDYATAEQTGRGKAGIYEHEQRKEKRMGRKGRETATLISALGCVALRCDYLGNNRAIAVTVLMAFHGYE